MCVFNYFGGLKVSYLWILCFYFGYHPINKVRKSLKVILLLHLKLHPVRENSVDFKISLRFRFLRTLSYIFIYCIQKFNFPLKNIAGGSFLPFKVGSGTIQLKRHQGYLHTSISAVDNVPLSRLITKPF